MKIYITEKQHRNIFEAMMPGFRLDMLISAKSFVSRFEYCKKMLGNPIGNGSSRVVFQIDDETCLKLAKNAKGVAQNMEEIRVLSNSYLSYVPKIYNGSDEEHGLWIITQYVIPAKKEDFERILGIPFLVIQKFAESTDKRFNYRLGQGVMTHANKVIENLYSKYENNDLVIELFDDIHCLKADYEQFVGDLANIKNWGMVMENGSTFLVMLDTGLGEEIFNQYYKR